MDRIYLNQTALSLGYIALKRIRALEAPTTRQPSSPLLRHVGHIKILAACVEQVGPDEIIEYEINQDYGIGGSTTETPAKEVYHVEDTAVPQKDLVRPEALSESQPHSTTRSSPSSKPLPVIKEDNKADTKELDFDDMYTIDERTRKKLAVTSLDPIDFEDEGDYSMDELYDEYNSQEEDWETTSELSEDDEPQRENVPSPSSHDQLRTSPRAFKDLDMDSEEEDTPSTPPSLTISRSPPLNISMRHPITHELSKREQYRREVEPAGAALSNTFSGNFEEILCQEMSCLSVRGISGEMRFGSHTNQRVSLYA